MSRSMLFLFWPLAAWQLAGQTVTVEGKVTDTLRGAPIENVLVWLRSTKQVSRPSETEIYATETDLNGHFLIHDVPAREYYAETHRDGFRSVSVGLDYYPKFTFTVGRRAKIALSMTPTAAISGRVVDADGDPVRNAGVGLCGYSYLFGRKQLACGPSATTDDRGEYRLPYIGSGTYYPRAFPPPMTTLWGRDVQRVRGFWFVPTYLASTLDFAQAKPLVVAAGTDVRVADIILLTERRYSIRGRFTDLQGGRRYSVLLRDLPESHDYSQFYRWRPPPPKYSDLETKVSGQAFEIKDVPPGKYYVTGQSSAADRAAQPLFARQFVEVADRDVEDVVLTFAPSFEIAGRVISEGLPFNPSGLRVALMWDWQDRPEARVKSDGTFALTGVRPEVYELQLAEGAPFVRGYLKSGKWGSREMADMRVDTTPGPQALTLVFTNDASTISGTVRDAKGRRISASVVVMPENAGQLSMSRPRVSYSNADGAFTVGEVPPGDYRILAFPRTENEAPNDSDFRKPYLDRAIRITVKPSASQSLNLRAVSMK